MNSNYLRNNVKLESNETDKQNNQFPLQKVLQNLVKGVNDASPSELSMPTNEDNNNFEFNEATMEGEEEEPLSEPEIIGNHLDNLDFTSVYQSFLTKNSIEDSDQGEQDKVAIQNEIQDPEDGPQGLFSQAEKKTCPFCFQQLSWHALSRHIRDMHRAKANLVTCQYCMKTFRNKNSLGCHIWRFHKRGKEQLD